VKPTTRYVAFLRGINAGNNAEMEDLRLVFKELGFHDVQTVISSGNVLFEVDPTDVNSLERIIEEALDKRLSLKSAANLRTEEELMELVASNPFKDIEITPKTRLYVTFLRDKPGIRTKLPLEQHKKGFAILSVSDKMVFSIVDLSEGTTPDLMVVLDKQFGKRITTRSWNTIERVLRKWGSPSPVQKARAKKAAK
jgi:uncharacterized protein (DUF1697 family)